MLCFCLARCRILLMGRFGRKSASPSSMDARPPARTSHRPLRPYTPPPCREEEGKMAALASDPKMCKRCVEPGCTLNCPCKQGYYCSKECQKADFPVHKHHCSVWLAKKMHKAERDHGGENEASADAKMDAAMGLQNRGKIQESLALISEARSVYKAVLPDTHFKIGQACGILGQMYKHLSRHDECMEMLKESDRVFRANEGESGPNVGVNLVCMGEVLKSQGKFREALAELDKGMAIYLTSPAFGPNHPNTGNMYCVKGDCHKGLGDYESAKHMYIKGIDILQKSGASPADLSRELSSLGKVHHEQGELAKAKQMFEASLGIYRQAFGESDSRVADQLNHVGRVLTDQGAEFQDEALKLHLKAFKIKRRIIGDQESSWDTTMAATLYDICKIYSAQGKFTDGLKVSEEALAAYTSVRGTDCLDSALAYFYIGVNKANCGDKDGAIEGFEQSVRIYKANGVAADDDRLLEAQTYAEKVRNGAKRIVFSAIRGFPFGIIMPRS